MINNKKKLKSFFSSIAQLLNIEKENRNEKKKYRFVCYINQIGLFVEHLLFHRHRMKINDD
jgi:hypothetical protein